MILILTEANDPHADRVVGMLEERGEKFLRFNPADFPSRASLSVEYAPNGCMTTTLRTSEQEYDLKEVDCVWNRRPKTPLPHSNVTDEATRQLVADECTEFVSDLWHTIPARWLPGDPCTIRRAQMKISQLRVAGALGFELPPTLITNEVDELLEFYNENNGNIIHKLIGFGFDRAVGDEFCRFTEVISKRNIAQAASIQYCPVIFQAYVPKKLELRITVVGSRVFAAEIHSQHTHHTRYDWRRYDLGQTPHFEHALPNDIENRCVQLVKQLGLTYGAIDMILTPDGRYVFVEINPNGQYLWIEEETNLPISAAICDYLLLKQPQSLPI